MAKIDDYVKDLGDALRTRDIDELKRFYVKYRGEMPPIDDKVLEISMHKMICNRTDMPRDMVMDSMVWLAERGFSPRI